MRPFIAVVFGLDIVIIRRRLRVIQHDADHTLAVIHSRDRKFRRRVQTDAVRRGFQQEHTGGASHVHHVTQKGNQFFIQTFLQPVRAGRAGQFDADAHRRKARCFAGHGLRKIDGAILIVCPRRGARPDLHPQVFRFAHFRRYQRRNAEFFADLLFHAVQRDINFHRQPTSLNTSHIFGNCEAIQSTYVSSWPYSGCVKFSDSPLSNRNA